uniref:Uncharacterized protein n=1 Tax=Romanomermis culicivorax TaxID=13658 RepID=A0A915LDC9_ROMCU
MQKQPIIQCFYKPDTAAPMRKNTDRRLAETDQPQGNDEIVRTYWVLAALPQTQLRITHCDCSSACHKDTGLIM